MERLEVLNGLYKSNTPHIVTEKHGGSTIRTEVYWYLAFYGPNHTIGLYGSGPDDYDPYISREFEMTGNIVEISENKIKLVIQNPHGTADLVFEGEILNNKRTLKLNGYKKDQGKILWVNEAFEYVEEAGDERTSVASQRID